MFDLGRSSDLFGHNAQGTRRQTSPVRPRASGRTVTGKCWRVLAALSSPRARPHRRCVLLGVLYTLVGISVISTFSVWSAVSRNGEQGSRTVDRRAMAEQMRSDFTNVTVNRTAAEQRPLVFKGVANSLGDLADLFAIRPANEKTLGKKEVMEDAPKKVEEKPHECSVKTVCPELEIPNLIEKRSLKLQDMPMNGSVWQVLGKDRQRVQRVVDTGNRELQDLLEKAARYNSSVRIPIAESLAPLGLRISNYTYLPGGHWKPDNCLPRWKVAIIFPFRNRSYHLPIVLRYLTPMLQRQLLEFAFYTVNQENSLAFNRAMLMNVGFLETLNFTHWDCFIFHDVDHVPLSDFNYYGCSGMPRHFLSGADRWKYKLPYNNFFGAVTGFTVGNIRKINGFPNVYWGWGGEDDEIWERVKEVGLPVSRVQGPHGYYDVIKHHHVSAPQLKDRMQLLKSFKPRFRLDGLNNLKYKKPHIELHALYTNISVDIQKLKAVIPNQQPKSTNARDKRSKTTINEQRVAAAKTALAKGHVNAKTVSEVKNKAASAVKSNKGLKPAVKIKPGDPQKADGNQPNLNGLAVAGDTKQSLNTTAIKKHERAPAKPES
ncbi:uncharacterized protein LOC119739393 isoform X2 [Patiria miniata]|uniref:Uncharacterized protein n=1 Tax=Patiria miniata TaxID=46514 RepID=A0A914B2X0_PATMI|nr:uncharacterized protein LOC119739393 isoform X2 [Patiria miniata]